MLLAALQELYERLVAEPGYGVPRPGYSEQKITFKVVIRSDGSLFDLQDVREPAKPHPRPRILVVPGGAKPTGAVTPRSVVKKVLPLRNDLPFLVGARVKTEGERRLIPAPIEFDAFRRFHLAIEGEIDDPHFGAVCRFLESWEPAMAVAHSEWADFADRQGVFQILGETGYVHDRPKVRSWWDNKQTKGGSTLRGQCLVTGAWGPIARLHEPRIKGVVGAQTSGATIVGFEPDAFKSHGLDQSFNAPVSEIVAFKYATALNALLDGPLRERHRVLLGDMTVAFWTDRHSAVEDIFATFLGHDLEPVTSYQVQDEDIRRKLELLLRALREGREAYGDLDCDPSHTRFYLVGLSPNAARIAVRFFYTDSLEVLLDHLRLHRQHMATMNVLHSDGQPHDGSPPIWKLLEQISPQNKGKPVRERIPPVLAGSLLRAVLTGSDYPMAIYQAVLRRCSVEGDVNHPRACIIKGFLMRNFRKEMSMSLDLERGDPGYRLGRLFAALEKSQRDALGDNLSRTIRESFYGSASATPAIIFPRLMKMYQHHLGKGRLDGGLKVNRERLVQEILEPLISFPNRLDLVGQGLFALGYYHQMQHFFTPRGNEARIEEGD